MVYKTQMTFTQWWDRVSDFFAPTIFHPQYFYKVAETLTVKEVKKVAGGTFLDVGCGRQWYRPIFYPMFSKYITLEKKENKGIYNSKYPIDIWADATNIPLQRNAVDVVLLSEMMEYLSEPHKVLRECRRVLTPKGFIIINVRDNYPAHHLPLDVGHYTQHGVAALLKTAGFGVVRRITCGNFWEVMAIYRHIFFMERVKKLIFKQHYKILGFTMLAIMWPLMTLDNILAIVLGGKKSADEFAISHVVVARPLVSNKK